MLSADFKLGQHDARAVRDKAAAVHTIAVTSGKGGVGKTNVAANLAHALARDGQSTLLLDADPGMANVDLLFDVHAPVTLQDVLAGERRLGEVVITGPDGLMIIPGASGCQRPAEIGPLECAGLVSAFSELERDIDALIIDTASGISEGVAYLCNAANSVIVVANNEPASIRDSVALIRLLGARKTGACIHVLANMVSGAREGERVFQWILESLGDTRSAILSYAGFVPCDDLMRKAVVSRKTVVSAYPGSRSAVALTRLCKQVYCWPRSRHAHGHIEFFVERLLQHETSRWRYCHER